MDKVRVVQQVQGALLNGLAEVQEPVEEHKGHVLPAQGPARHPRLVEGLCRQLTAGGLLPESYKEKKTFDSPSDGDFPLSVHLYAL